MCVCGGGGWRRSFEMSKPELKQKLNVAIILFLTSLCYLSYSRASPTDSAGLRVEADFSPIASCLLLAHHACSRSRLMSSEFDIFSCLFICKRYWLLVFVGFFFFFGLFPRASQLLTFEVKRGPQSVSLYS